MPVLHYVLWICNIALEVAVPFLMAWKRHYRTFPAIFLYLVINLLQAVVVYAVYLRKGYNSWPAFWTYWISQGVVVLARWTAVSELCRLILGQYKGIWALAWRVLAVLGGSAMLLALTLGGHNFVRIISTFDLSLEVSMGIVLLAFFFFAGYYKVVIENSLRTMAIAFCLYSLFRAFNDLVLQSFLRGYASTWNLVDETTYFATLMLLGSAVYLFGSVSIPRVVLLPRSAYAEIAPQINARLSLLNERLSEFLRSKQAGKA